MEATSDPTPAEIRAACEAIQASWSAEERQRRRRGLMPGRRGAVGHDPAPLVVPLIHVDSLVAAALNVVA